MQNGSSLEASSNVVPSSETVNLPVDGETLGKLTAAAGNVDESGCCIMMATND